MGGPFFTLADLGLPVSPTQMLQLWLTQMQTTFPGYDPSAGDLDFIQAQIFAQFASDVAQMCSSGSQELFRTFGTALINLPFQLGSAASTIVTVTAVDTAGYTLPAGTQLTLTLTGAPVGFQTVSPLTIAAGSSSGQVSVVAVQNGSAFNGAAAPAQLISQIQWVSALAPSAPASGGADQEDDSHYLTRLAQTLQLMALRPITASDFAAVALNFTPAAGTDQQEVGRATAIDGYDPTSNTFGNEREVTVFVTDASGNPLNTDTMYGVGGSSGNVVTNPASWGVAGWLSSLREVNFLVNVLAPSYTTVYVSVTVKAAQGFLPATVQANVQAALLRLLSPGNWPPLGTSFANSAFTNTTVIPRSRVAAVIQDDPSVDHIVTGSLAIDLTNPPTNTTSDVVLGGPVPLPVTSTSSIPLSAITVI